MSTIRGLIFDMDGVLLDTEKIYFHCWLQSAKELGYPMSEEAALHVRSCCAAHALPYFRQLYGENFDYFKVRDRRRELVSQYIAEHGVEQKSGIAELLQFCRESGLPYAIATATSADDGSFSFTDVPYGNWVLKELESPEGFVLSDEIFSVTIEEDGQVVEISLANERVYGDLRLTKVDKDYPDNKLTGAEFEVYRDTNGNKELDEGDELLGKLEETSTGIYEMSHILYGGVFVKETKAPEGYLLDENAYYVEIVENGKIYEVENEAGKGFVNAAQTGSLRIEKTSSDGKVEGFSFRVTGANGYDQTFKTDSTGKIEITGLRVGDYTVSEVSDNASANYVLPADKTVTIFADKTTVAQMHNELRDTPKTGDESKPWLWMTLMGVSAAGTAVLGIAAYVSKRRKDEESAE